MQFHQNPVPSAHLDHTHPVQVGYHNSTSNSLALETESQVFHKSIARLIQQNNDMPTDVKSMT